MYLQQFTITFRYLPGRFNVMADYLSRHPLRLHVSCQTRSQRYRSYPFRRDPCLKRMYSFLKAVFTKTDLYLNPGVGGEGGGGGDVGGVTPHTDHPTLQTDRSPNMDGPSPRMHLTELLIDIEDYLCSHLCH